IYDGKDDEGFKLYMWGKIFVKNIEWIRVEDGTEYEIKNAEPGWIFYPRIDLEITNAPVWDFTLAIKLRFDVVWWLDEDISPSLYGDITNKILPGRYSVYFGDPDPYTFEVPVNREYGQGIGQTKGIYGKVFVNNKEIYSSNDYGNELFVKENIPNYAPILEILNPNDGDIILEDSVILSAQIFDPNGPLDISSIKVFVDDSIYDVTSDYNPNNYILITNIPLPDKIGSPINVTTKVTDSAGASAQQTILIFRGQDTFFPSNYIQQHAQFYTYELFNKEFLYKKVFMWSPNEDYNVTIIPTIRFGVKISSEFNMYYAMPSELKTGEDLTLLLKLTDPTITITLDFEIFFRYYIKAVGYTILNGTHTFVHEELASSLSLPIGVNKLDLRYDVPGISEAIQSLTHYEVDIAKLLLPVPMSWLFECKVILDIIPILKLYSGVSAEINALGATLDKNELNWFTDNYLAIGGVTNGENDGQLDISLSNINWHLTAGMDIGANISLTGSIGGFDIGYVNINKWLYEHLGIVIPELHLWFPTVTVPLVTEDTLILSTPISPANLIVKASQINADENNIYVYIKVIDENSNLISNADVTAIINGNSYSATNLGDGLYRFKLPFIKEEFTMNIKVEAPGYNLQEEKFKVYIDPVLVDSTPPRILNIEINPASPTSQDNVLIAVQLSDNLSGVATVILSYKTGETSNWVNVTMNYDPSKNAWVAWIPKQTPGTTVVFLIYAYDNAGNLVISETNTYSIEGESGGGVAPSMSDIIPILALGAIISMVVIYYIHRRK
ncbi:MAG: hypothetical protein ACTSVW_07640, partial [Candidatus Njordarchaeales archaeon]